MRLTSPVSSLPPFPLVGLDGLEFLDFLATVSLAGTSAGLFPVETASLFVGDAGLLFFVG